VLDIDMFQNWDAWKAQFRERSGLDFSLDYITLGALATDSLDNTGTASGVARFYGQWDLVNRGDPNQGSFIFKIESRHKYSPDAPADFGSDIGYAGTNYLVFADTPWRVQHLEWQQHFCDGEWVWYAGFFDTTDFVDVYALGSPWESFTNLTMSSGSAMINLPSGALGAVLGGFLIPERVYVVGMISDINGDPTQISFDSFFNQSEYLTTFEIGLTSSKEKLFLDNAHVTFWHVDPRQQAGTAEQWGVTTNFCKVVKENWLPFVRGGWSTPGGGGILQTSVTAGIGYQRDPSKNVTAIGVNWGQPNEDTYGPGLNSQWTVEAFQLLQMTQELQVTPSVQLIWDPALNPDTNFLALFGLRMRLVF
jgi:porin